MAKARVTEVTEEKVNEETVQEQAQDKDSEIERLKAEIASMKAAMQAAPVPAPAGNAVPVEDEWEQYEEIYVPRHGNGQEPNFYVSVNFRNASIPADGKMHRIRKPLAEALRQSIDAEAKAESFAENIPHDAAPGGYEEMQRELNSMKRKLAELGIN